MSSNIIQRLITILIFSIIAVQLTHAQAFPWRIQADSLVTDTLGAGTAFEKIEAPDTLHAMAVSTYGGMISVFRTTNGGTTWEQSLRHWAREKAMHDISHPTPHCAVIVGDTMYRYVDTGSTIFYTHDGGGTWQQGWCDSCKLPDGSRYDLWHVSMCDSLNGVLSAFLSCIARTTDGGRTWRRIPDPTNGQELFYEIQCLSSSTWFLTTSVFRSGITSIYRTTDSGRTWTHSLVPKGTGFCDFIDSLQGWSVGYRRMDDSGHINNKIARTVDGGRTWDTLYDMPAGYKHSRGLLHISMANATYGIAAGYEGIWFYTTDGTKWQEGPRLDSTFNYKFTDIIGLTYPHPNKAWGLAPAGKILVYEPKTASVVRTGHVSTATTIAIFPNPVPRSTPATIALEIHEHASSVRLIITNALGEEVNAVEVPGALDPGEHRIAYAAPAVSGYYFVRLTSKGRTIACSTIIVQ